MFNTLKRFFGRRGEASTIDASEEEYQQFTPPPGAMPVPRSSGAGAARSGRVDAQPAPVARAAANAPSSLSVPLKSVIARLPADLMQRVRLLDVGEAELFIPMQKVLSQISTGAVRLSFGELRQIAPPGTFTPENDRDRALVELPLHEVLARLNPGLLTRRPAQRHVDVPPEVTGPFGGQTKVTFSTAPLKPAQTVRPERAPAGQPPLRGQQPAAPRQQPYTVPVQPAPRVQPAVPPGQPVFARIRPQSSAPSATPVSPFAPAVAAPVAEEAVAEAQFTEAPIFTRAMPAAPPAPVRPVYSPIAPQPQPAYSSDTEVIQMPGSFTKLPPVAPITPIAPVAEPEPAPIRFAAAPVQAPVFTPAPAPVPAPAQDDYSAPSGETRFVNVSLAELSQSWPEALRQEITGQNLSGMTVGLPFGAVEGVIKTGKIAFPWKALRSWIKSPVPAYVSAYDTTLLELPLKVVTPLFLAELKATRSQRRVSMDEQIPDLFFDARVPEAVAAALSAPPAPPAAAVPVRPVAPPAAAHASPPPAPKPLPAFPAAAQTSHAKPADTNYFVWKEKSQPQPESQPQSGELEDEAGNEPATPGTAFLNRYATPNEIVSKAAALEGVDGALIALPDGLLVASRIPPNMNADTIAAFLPQIFGRVSQCTRELRLGELNNLNFTVGNIPWKIFRVGAIYFAAFGRPGVPLPTAQLVGLAAELDRKAK